MNRADITSLFPDATRDQVDKLMSINGDDINKAKGELETLKTQLADVQKELESAKKDTAKEDELKAALDRAEALQNELDSRKRSDSIREMRAKVAKETQVPVELLSYETEEECVNQAKAIADYAKTAGGYPSLPDGGEVTKPVSTGSNAAWESFAAQINKQ